MHSLGMNKISLKSTKQLYLDATYFSYISSLACLASSSCRDNCWIFSSAKVERLADSVSWRLRYSLSCFSNVSDCLAVDSWGREESQTLVNRKCILIQQHQ